MYFELFRGGTSEEKKHPVQDDGGDHDDAHDDGGEGDGDHAFDVTTPTDLVDDHEQMVGYEC